KRRRDIQGASPDVPPDALGRHRDGTEFPVQIGVNTLDAGDRRLIATAIVDLSARRAAEDEVLEIARQQAAIADLGRRALEGLEFQPLLDEAVRLAARILDVELTKVLELRPDGRALLVRAGVGWKPGVVGHALVPVHGRSQAGTALRTSEPIVVQDLPTDSRFGATALLDEH